MEDCLSSPLRRSLAGPAMAQSRGRAGLKARRASVSPRTAPESRHPPPVMSETRHAGVFGGQRIAYRAIAGETYLKDKRQAARGHGLLQLHQGRPDGPEPSRDLPVERRPRLRLLWLHMGAFGPKRVVVPSDARDDGRAPASPSSTTSTLLLDVTDIVFIDPIGAASAAP